jgi:hypothetical protein
MTKDMSTYREGFSYPDSVSEFSGNLVDVLEEFGFFVEEPDANPSILFKNFCEEFMPKWIEGKSPEEYLENEDAFQRVIVKSITESVLTDLKERGMVDSIEDENGEEVFFLTPIGKGEVESMNGLDPENIGSKTA